MGLLFHPSLEDQDRGHAVHGLTALFDRQVRFPEEPVGLCRREAFVPEMNWQAEFLAEVFRESTHLFGLRSLGAAHAQGEADHDFLDVEIANHAPQVFEVIAFVLTLKGFESLGCDSKRIGDRDADTAGTDVECQNAAASC